MTNTTDYIAPSIPHMDQKLDLFTKFWNQVLNPPMELLPEVNCLNKKKKKYR